MKFVRVAVLFAVLFLGMSVRPAIGSSSARSLVAACAPSVPHSNGSFTEISAAGDSFGFRLFAKLLDSAGSGNVLISPVSAAIALDLVYDGARSATERDMAGVLGLTGMSRVGVATQSAALLSAFKSSDPKAKLAIANALWVRAGFQLQHRFINDAKRFYGARLGNLNFNSPAATGTINAWVSCATHKTISSIVSRIPSDVVLYLMDAVYFHGLWTTPFKTGDTHNQSFTTAGGQMIQVPMMNNEASFPYYQGSNFQLISLPYGTGRFSMIVLLPSAGTSLRSFRPRPSPSNWRSWLSHLKSEYGSVGLPRFSVRNTLGLKTPLSDLGMASGFSQGANFLGICKQPCRLTDVRQKTFLDVYEKGTTAAAVTSVGVSPTAVRQPSFRMVVDHPFFLGICDRRTASVLFLAVVNNPLA